jgi:hypothetical protein
MTKADTCEWPPPRCRRAAQGGPERGSLPHKHPVDGRFLPEGGGLEGQKLLQASLEDVEAPLAFLT